MKLEDWLFKNIEPAHPEILSTKIRLNILDAGVKNLYVIGSCGDCKDWHAGINSILGFCVNIDSSMEHCYAEDGCIFWEKKDD